MKLNKNEKELIVRALKSYSYSLAEQSAFYDLVDDLDVLSDLEDEQNKIMDLGLVILKDLEGEENEV